MKKHNGLSAFGDKRDKSISPENREKIIRKSYALTKNDIKSIQKIKDQCLNKKVVLNDSHIVRISLMLASKLDEDTLIKASAEVPKLIAGRPKASKIK